MARLIAPDNSFSRVLPCESSFVLICPHVGTLLHFSAGGCIMLLGVPELPVMPSCAVTPVLIVSGAPSILAVAFFGGLGYNRRCRRRRSKRRVRRILGADGIGSLRTAFCSFYSLSNNISAEQPLRFSGDGGIILLEVSLDTTVS